MRTLVVDQGCEQAVEYPLRTGCNQVGRAPDNDVVVEDESVSEHHCELDLFEGGVRVRDLQSLNGTCVDGVQIEEAFIETGQTLQIGLVEMVLQDLETVESTGGRVPDGVSLSSNHEEGSVPGGLYCNRCRCRLGPGEASERRVGAQILHFCPRCGNRCDAGVAAANSRAKQSKEPTFMAGVTGAFGYPFRAGGGSLLVAGAVALTVTDYAAMAAGYAFLLGLVALVILAIGVIGYLFEFVKHVVTSSAGGDETIPNWPEVTSPADFLGPFLQFIALVLFCFGPLIVWSVWGPEWGGIWIPALLILGGALYFPMALLAVSMGDSIGGVNPALVVPSILRIPKHYAVASGLMCGVLILQVVSQSFIGWIPVPVLPTLLAEFVTLYLTIVCARVLGVTYFFNEGKLGWFARRGSKGTS